jgi:hypothetical protein
MTATLNSLTCASVKVVIPRYGNWTAWATLASDDAVTAAPGGLTLAVAGLSLVGTVRRQGTRNGLRSVELEGGYGGWSRSVSPRGKGGGLKADNLVRLEDVAKSIALEAGERVSLAAGVDRKVGAVVAARLGGLDAGALLSQACASPAGAPVVPWWVDTDGTTRLGARTGAAVTALAVDSDGLGRAYVYTEDDATPLLPGATIDGATIAELTIEASDTVTEVATVALADEEPETFHALLRRFVLRVVGPHVSARTLYRYVVKEVHGDGRIRAVPVRSFLAPDLDLLRVWPGIAGGRCVPKTESEILVQFADGDPVAAAACIVGFTPAIANSRGIPDRAELDGDEVVLASGTLPCGRGGATLQFGTGEVFGSVYVTLTDPDGAQQSWAFACAAGPLTVAPSPTPVIDGTIGTIDPGRDEVKV